MRKVTTQLAALALLLVSGSAFAWQCDFLTGGGFIITNGGNTHPPAKANFGVGGGCKNGSPTWGHLEYIDHGNGLNVHWTSITAYLEVDTSSFYDTTTQCFPHFLGSTAPCAPGDGGGGNIQLHKPNPSTTGSFGGSCPAL